MSIVTKLSIKNYRGIKELNQDFGSERFVVFIGRGDSGKSTILSAINAVLSPSWNMAFSDLDFYQQDTTRPIEIEVTLRELPNELLKESKFGMYIQNDLKEDENVSNDDLSLIVKLVVNDTLEPHWFVKAHEGSGNSDKPISGTDRALIAVNYISDYSDNQFAYNRLSPIYALTKAKLDNGITIERLKSQLIRSMTESVSEDILEPLNKPLTELTTTAQRLGLNIDNLCATVDIKENPYTGNGISLHDNSMPYRLHGKGSKRLMSIAIQSEMTKEGGIVLVDELEQGLEPDRIVTLIRKLKETQHGQVFITTHSLNVILEANSQNLFVVNKESISMVDKELDACRRSNPQAFFAKKVICCEGKTEEGFIRALDTWIWDKYHTSLSAKGVVIVNAGGGDKMFTYAIKLKALGYETCTFADDDKSAELAAKKKETDEAGIPLFLCEKGNCIERQLFFDLPWECMKDIVDCDTKAFPHNHIQLPDDFKNRMVSAQDDESQKSIREELVSISTKKNKEWFKHIPGGEFLGNVFFNHYPNMDEENNMKKVVTALLTWCGIIQ